MELRLLRAVMAGQGLGCAPVIEGTVPFDPVHIASRPLSPELGAAEVSLSESEMAEIERILNDIPSK